MGFEVGSTGTGPLTMGWGPNQYAPPNPMNPMSGQSWYRNSSLPFEMQGGGYQAAKMQQEAAELPAQLRQQRFNTVWGSLFPWVQNTVFPWAQGFAGQALGKIGTGGTGGGSAAGGGPEINVGPVWDAQRQQQAVNQMRANTDASIQSQMRNVESQAAGRGYGAQSPFVAQMQNQLFGQGLAQKTGGATDIYLKQAQANADMLAKTQALRESQFASRQQEEIERQKTASSLLASIFGSALGGFGNLAGAGA